ncbi:GntR family transcriptional regulator [Ligilactobacillus pobuzihii]|uniref:Transcription regulator n=1 Tax=Ligilactobacillus pobuzihii TaxID=449659 RepID=A0A0R2L8I1_9LACO|nr:GntR family transcriptional regulator [Ligilactobacillus pobuzihii]KRK10647.1 transcription regulator [Ligilactobacillus pobuzihii E100301 = KCTC 13174]KRN98091.1 transcription regulator [Ligilactobacillus pobuzihii]GEN47476.1 GntR family transcriptional regulator [Ligilactobacillus pobuzihii]
MYHKVAEDIIQAILTNKYTDKLPTEKELVAQYHVSRNTIRKALDVVFAHGLLRRVRGSGYYVIKKPLQSQKILNLSIGFDENSMVSGGPLRSKVLKFDTITADKDLALRGNVAVNSRVYRVVRLRYLQGQLYSLEESYFPRNVVPFLTEESVQTSIFSFLRDAYQMTGSTSENYVHASKISEQQADLLKRQQGDQILCLDGINYLASGKVFNFSRTYFVYDNLALYYHTQNIDI